MPDNGVQALILLSAPLLTLLGQLLYDFGLVFEQKGGFSLENIAELGPLFFGLDKDISYKIFHALPVEVGVGDKQPNEKA